MAIVWMLNEGELLRMVNEQTLHRMLNKDELRDSVLLVFSNKQDLSNERG